MHTAALNTRTKGEHAYRAIKDLILRNDLRPGDHLPVNRLARTLGISPTPVREAVLKLQADGLLIGEQHKQLRVAPITPDDVSQLFEARRLLEPYGMRKVTQAVGRDSGLRARLDPLKRLSRELATCPPDRIAISDYVTVDRELNAVLLQAVNPFLRGMLEIIGDRSTRIRTFAEVVDETARRHNVGVSSREHLAIIDAVLSGDARCAEEATRRHLDAAEKRTLSAVARMLVENHQPITQDH